MLQHGVKKSQQRMPARRQGDFVDFPRREEPFVTDVALRVEARGHQRAHLEHRAHMRAPAPEHAPPAEGPAVTMPRRHADHGRALLPRARPQRGEFQ